MKTTNKTQDNSTRNPDLAMERKEASLKMNTIFNGVRNAQQEKPERWKIDARTEVNDHIKLVQFLFDQGWYANAIYQVELLDSIFRITGRKYQHDRAEKTNDRKPKKEKELVNA